MTTELGAVIVVGWNRWDDSRQCLASLAPVGEEGWAVLFVDNGSNDGSARLARAEFPWIEVLESRTNLGFGGGCNLGLRNVLARGMERAILLNNDTVVAPDFARRLEEVASRYPRVGTVSAKVLCREPPERIWFAGASLSTWSGRSAHTGFGEIDRGQYDIEREIDRPCACALLATRPFLEEVGLLDESLFLYGEEIDWTLRGRALGYRHYFAPRARVWHQLSRAPETTHGGRPYYYLTRNLLTILDRLEPISVSTVASLRRRLVMGVLLVASLRAGVPLRWAWSEIASGARDYRRGVCGPKPTESSTP